MCINLTFERHFAKIFFQLGFHSLTETSRISDVPSRLSVPLDQLKLKVDRKAELRNKGEARIDVQSPAWEVRKAGRQGHLEESRAHAAVRVWPGAKGITEY